jgi:transcriptional regulator with XRE-family HTH domain
MEGQITQRRWSRPPRFPNRIREYRTQAGLSQRHLALMIRQGRGSVSAWERGQYLPTVPNLFRLARALDTLGESLYYPLYQEARPQHELSNNSAA